VVVNFERGLDKESIEAFVLAREESVGIYPGILQDLFNKRKQVKKVLEAIDE
jgi:hypothetical protein